MKQAIVPRDALGAGAVPWALQMKAISWEEPRQLLKCLTAALLGCGGSILGRCASPTGRVDLLFEFQRRGCLEVYSGLIAAGLELSQGAHCCFTALCQCTWFAVADCGQEIVSVDLQVQTFPSVYEHAPRSRQ